MQSPTTPAVWVPQRVAADHFGISERTLTRLRNGSNDYGHHTPAVLTPGVHWRRMSASPRSKVIYSLQGLDQVLSELSARAVTNLEASA